MDLLRNSKLDSALVEICSSRVLISLRYCACGAVDDDPVDVYIGNTSLKSLRLAV
jgi:hypothetical protein